MIIGLILFIIGIILSCISIYKIKNVVQLDHAVEKELRALDTEKEQLKYECNQLKQKIEDVDIQLDNKKQEFIYQSKKLTEFQNNIDNLCKDKEESAHKEFQQYCQNLEHLKKDRQADFELFANSQKEEYDYLTNRMKQAYSDNQKLLLTEYNKIKFDLEEIKKTKEAIIQANLREQEIKENSTFYCLQLADADKVDIKRLEAIKPTLNKPRVLSMLIWSTWYQKPLKTLSAKILGSDKITGIYKITNIITGQCYIGQSVDIAARWAEHAKCGLGIDTPAGNKLYASMKEYGLDSFSWELLESCGKEKLNEKEKYYIDLYDAYNLGFNSTIGNKGVGK